MFTTPWPSLFFRTTPAFPGKTPCPLQGLHYQHHVIQPGDPHLQPGRLIDPHLHQIVVRIEQVDTVQRAYGPCSDVDTVLHQLPACGPQLLGQGIGIALGPEAEVLSAERGKLPRGQVVSARAAPQPELRVAGRQEEFCITHPLTRHSQNIFVKMDACV